MRDETMPKRKFWKLYKGPGYPVDPKLEEERLHFVPLKEPVETYESYCRKRDHLLVESAAHFFGRN